MADERRVNINVGATGVENLEIIQRRARETYRDLRVDAQRYSNDLREQNKYIEEHIRLAERLNRTTDTSRGGQLTRDLGSGKINKAEFESQFREHSRDSRSNELTNEYLRRLLAEQQTSNKEIKTNISGFGLLSRTINSRSLPEAGIDAVGQVGGGMMGMGGRAGAIGIALALGAMVGGKAVQAGMMYQGALGSNVGVFGGSMQDYQGFGRGFSDLGYTMEQSARRRLAMSRAAGRMDLGNLTAESFYLERGAGLDEGLQSQLLMMGRNDRSGLGLYGGVNRMVSSMRGAGAIKGDDLSLLPEYMQTLIHVSQEQLKVTGSVDVGINTKMISAIASLDDSLKNPQVLTQMMTQLRSGLTSGNPQVEALQYSVLSKMAPGSSMFRLMEMREDPFGRGNEKYMQNYLGSLRGMSGSSESFYMNIMNAFGLGAKQSKILGSGFEGGDLSRAMAGMRGEDLDIVGRAKEATPKLLDEVAKFTNVFQESGSKLATGLSDLTDTIKGLIKSMGETSKNPNVPWVASPMGRPSYSNTPWAPGYTPSKP